ncbi:efflux RND transporter periplasmic adaptor subunit [Leptospirillum ferriphilum]|uniref:Efflux transporter, RND family, MFP subunit n=3 Tax=Leptospirillum ferriphilum TaxID=178606 RepID=J9Z9K6_LEPFM|nr:efflux RND transporter periplasmic adaptor subunit [Leptospirillum ferriphilum]AFS52623.1 efflux transporter, RND family, MFP subunit [Leptospirillum ferriphilum ML-04]
MLPSIRWFPFGIALSLMAGGLFACHQSGGEKRPSAQPPVSVDAIVIQPTGGQREGQVSAVVRARHEALIKSRVSGRVLSIPVALGQVVRKGEVLVRLSSGSQEAAVQAADATLQEARKNFDRIDALFQSSSATRAELDSAKKELDVALAQDQRAHSILGWSEIRAPFPGRISQKRVRVGDTVVPGTPLIAVLESGALEVKANLPSSWAGRVQPGQRATLEIGFPPRHVPVTIREIAAGTDPLSHTVRIRGNLSGADARGLRAGMFGTLSVPIGTENRILVPRSAVLDQDGLKEVFVVEGGKSYLQYVKTGKEDADRVEILSGLSGGETVVIHSDGRLENGTPVRVKGAA